MAPHLERLKNHFPFGNKLYLKLINNCPELQSFVTTIEPVKVSFSNNVYNNNTNCYLNPVQNVNSVNNNNNKRMNRRSFNDCENLPRNAKMKTNKFATNAYN